MDDSMEPWESGAGGIFGRCMILVLLLVMGGGAQVMMLVPLAYAVYLSFLWCVQVHLLFPVVLLKEQEQADPPQDCRVTWVGDEEGKSEAWYFQAASEAPASTVCIFHGNGEYISAYLPIVEWLNEEGFNVLLPEYRGYGRSEGTPIEEAIVGDVLKHFEALSHVGSFSPDRLIYMGVSVGGGVAASVATKRPPLAIVAMSTFYSIPRIAQQYGVPEVIARGMLYNIFDNRHNLQAVRAKHNVPIFMAHGTQDTIVNIEHARQLADELGVKLYTRPCGHNFNFDNDMKQRIRSFLPAARPASPLGESRRTPSVTPASP
eukprot:TRINITY_DN58571_c0_g1_i1.p1 TRINITY_DN58571_c0_g1~~TRINITY_DN58571_c0_g1_i1.p1  ORF type:complete len:338 (+),score=118.11 TRINITY_DN58571_c0_g1_i1:62-1015(+)